MSGRALITGSEGFAGRVLARRLRGNGWEVAGSDHVVHGESESLFRCDVSNAADVERLFARAGDVTHVFHLAGMTYVPESIEHPGGAMRANYEGTVNILNAVKKNRPEARVIAVTSSDIYGPPCSLPIDEQHPFQPTNPYSISKAAADRFCEFYGAHAEIDIVRARPFNHSGAGQNDRFVLSSFARQTAEIEAGLKEPVVRAGNLAAARDFAHVEDVVRAYELLALHGKRGEAYNICSGESHAIREALEHLLSMAKVPIRWEVDPARWRPDTVHEVRGSHEKLTRDTGWEPELTFDDLLADLLNDWRMRVKADIISLT